jgi:hypothetical protein
MVDFAVCQEQDGTLHAEVQCFRCAHNRVGDLAEQLANIQKQYNDTRWEEYNSLCTLACTNAFCHLESCILHNALTTSDIPWAVLNAGLNDFTNGWKNGPDKSNVYCLWCSKNRHPMHHCTKINQCLLCYRTGHIKEQCHIPHKRCCSGRVCYIPNDHPQVANTYCATNIRTFG